MANNTHDLIKGLLVASALGGASYLFSPKKEEACKKGCKGCKECECSHGPMVAGSFIAGAVLGGIAGLLLAPSSGEDLRKDLGSTCDDVRAKAEKLLNDLNEKGCSVASNAADSVDEWKKSLSSILNSLTGPELKRQASTKFNEVADWAALGLSVWDKLQKRK